MNYFVLLQQNTDVMRDFTNLNSYRQSLRHRIIEKAMSLFKEHGIRAVKMDDVAHSLSISKRTLYEIYSTKEELLLEVITCFRKRHAEQLAEKSSSFSDVMDVLLYVYRTKIEEFHTFNPVFYSDLVRYPAILQSFEKDSERQRAEFLDFMQRGVDEGFFRADINYELVEKMFSALGHLLMANELYRMYSMEELFRNMIFVTLRGMCTKKGAERLDTFLDI